MNFNARGFVSDFNTYIFVIILFKTNPFDALYRFPWFVDLFTLKSTNIKTKVQLSGIESKVENLTDFFK